MASTSSSDPMETLLRGCEHVYSAEELEKKLARSRETGRPLRVKLGLDPTAPDIHLGHTVVLRKMRQFQDCGHKAVLIIGDYTARIGDPSGKTKTRPVLGEAEVEANARTYLDQAGKILNLAEDRIEIRRNSEWLAALRFEDALRLASKMTVARMMERDTFEKRYKAGKEIFIHEFLYPLMQGYDSVAIQADVELGGTDQTFNNLVGRDLQRDADQPAQVVMVMPILVGLDGREKMSKSLGNYVGVSEPAPEMFAKLMSLSDDLMANYLELLTDIPPAEMRTLLDAGTTHPRDAKVRLATEIVTHYWGAQAARKAREEFFRIHGGGQTGLPDDMDSFRVPADLLNDGSASPVALVVACGFATSNSDARRLIAEGGIRLEGRKLDDPTGTVTVTDGAVLQRGKRKFVRLRVP